MTLSPHIALRPNDPAMSAYLKGRVPVTKSADATLTNAEVLGGLILLTTESVLTLPPASATNAGADLYVSATAQGMLLSTNGFHGASAGPLGVRLGVDEGCHVYCDGTAWYLVGAGPGSSLEAPGLKDYVRHLADLVAYWPLDEGSGVTARDLGPNNLPLTLIGATWSEVDGYVAPYFDGVNDYATRGVDDTELDLVNSFSFLALVRPISSGGWPVARYWVTGDKRSWGLKIANSTTAQLNISSNGTFSPPTTAEQFFFTMPGLGEWFLLSISYDYDAGAGTATVKAWINATQVLDTTTTIGPLYDTSVPFELGRAQNVYLEGYIAHAAITSLGDIGPYVANIARLMGVA